MGASSRPIPCDDGLRSLIQTVKQACRQQAIDAYEDAQIRGLCAQGAFEVAMQALLDAPVPLEQVMPKPTAPPKETISLKRVYDAPSQADGVRVLVDRLWPRGLAKADAHIDHWLKAVAPSDALRKAFGHDVARWPDFQKRYHAELTANDDAQLRQLVELTRQGPITLLYAARDEAHNNAVALAAWLRRQRQ